MILSLLSVWQEALKRPSKHLKACGLDVKAVKLVVPDGTKGLLTALDTHLPGAQLRRCSTHIIRGFERYLRYRHLPEIDQDTRQNLSKEEARHQRRKEIKTDAYDIFKAPTKGQAQQRLDTCNE